jgi:hypothetical protein
VISLRANVNVANQSQGNRWCNALSHFPSASVSGFTDQRCPQFEQMKYGLGYLPRLYGAAHAGQFVLPRDSTPAILSARFLCFRKTVSGGMPVLLDTLSPYKQGELLASLATRGALPRTPGRLLVLTGTRGNQFPRSRFAGRRVPYKSRDGAVQEPLPALDCATPCKTAAHVTGPACCTCGAVAPVAVADCGHIGCGSVLPLVAVGEFDRSLECPVNALQAVVNA